MTRRVPTMLHWGAYDLTVTGSEVESVDPLLDDPDPSPLGEVLKDSRTARVARPAVRRSWLEDGHGAATHLRGREPFVEVDWDHALDLLAAELRRVRAERGGEGIYAGSYGWASAGRFHHAQSQLKRFLTLTGGFVGSVGTYSHGAAEVVIPHVLGMSLKELLRSSPPLSEVAEHTERFVSFGGVPAGNAQIVSGGSGTHLPLEHLRAAARRGCRFTSISPVRTEVDEELGAEWLPLRPGTDVAVMLALVHSLIEREVATLGFLASHCAGSELLIDHVLGREDGVAKSPAWAEHISGVPAERIDRLAQELTTARSMLNGTWSLQRAAYGENAVWGLIALAATVGQCGLRGGGFGFGYGSMGSVGAPVCSPPAPALPTGGTNPVEETIPVARVADMLLDPGGTYEFDGATRRYPDVDLVYWAGGNPFHHHQDLGRLASAWQRPSTVVVHEPFWTATAQRADIVLPTTTPLERRDLGGGSTDAYLVAMEPAFEPFAEARDDHAIFASLAERLGRGGAFSEGRSAEEWQVELYARFRAEDPSLDDYATFRRVGHVRRTPQPVAGQRLERFLQDPEGVPLATVSGRIELGSERIAGFGYEGCPGHAAWIEPWEWLGSAGPSQLHLLSPQPHDQLHSQYDFAAHVDARRDEGRARLRINPADARARGVVTGDVVAVHNQRGRCAASAEVTAAVMAGVVVLPTGAWWEPYDMPDGRTTCLRGNPNVLTRDQGTSAWAQATSAHTCVVEVEPWPEAPPPPPHAAARADERGRS